MDVILMGTFLEQQGFSDEAIDDYLEHHGVRGQRWGVKNSSSKGSTRESRRQALTPGVRRTHTAISIISAGMAGRVIAKGLGLPVTATTLGAAAGAAVTIKLLNRHGNKKAAEVANARKVLFGDKP